MTCELCEELKLKDCINCTYGNPCLDCDDYERKTNTCNSNGGCGDMRGDNE